MDIANKAAVFLNGLRKDPSVFLTNCCDSVNYVLLLSSKYFKKMDNQISISELLRSVGQLSTHDFEDFFIKIQSLRHQKTASDGMNIEESKLLKQIKTGLLSTKQTRFEYLIARRDARTITESEFEELLKLTHEIEKNDVIRLKRIAKLADLKRMTLPEVVSFYNLQPTQHG